MSENQTQPQSTNLLRNLAFVAIIATCFCLCYTMLNTNSKNSPKTQMQLQRTTNMPVRYYVIPDPQKEPKMPEYAPIKHFYFHMSNIGELVWRLYD